MCFVAENGVNSNGLIKCIMEIIVTHSKMMWYYTIKYILGIYLKVVK